ncbi:response regulator [Aquisediminimonas sediminicola]|uniref:response regulator n=1 Tax=Alteraquisediminimonas sediminicola TaxID=2676787 RepID=UPI001C8D5B64
MPFRYKDAGSQRPILKIVLLYALLGGAWILISDKVVEFLVSDPVTRVQIGIFKGWAYVALTSVFLYILIVRFWRQTLEVSQRQLKTLGLLEAIAEKTSEAIYAKDREGRYIFFNKAGSVFVGQDVAKVLGKDDSAFFPPEQARELQAHDARLMAEGRTETRQELVDTAFGPRLFLATKGPLFDHEGQIFGTFGMSRDITEQRMAEEDMNRLNRALRLLGEGNMALLRVSNEQQLLQEMCALVTAAGGYRMAWIGYPEQGGDKRVVPMAEAGTAAVYLANVRISWDETLDIGRGPTGVAIRTGRPQINHDVMNNPDMVPWRQMAMDHGYRSSVALPLICEHVTFGVLTIYAAEPDAFTDSEMGVLEELAANLAFGIHALRERQERRAAEVASKAKSSFLANMSHEIRTPLTAITGMAHLLERSRLAPRQREMVSSINVAVGHLLDVINDILDLSKIEAGKLSLQDVAVDIDRIIADAVKIIKGRPRPKGVELCVVNGTIFPPLRGDPLRLQQALLNYLSNAVKFTDKGSITVRISCVEDNEDDVLLRIEVEDTGIGIAADTLPRLFMAFEQADNSSARSFAGTGLGLAITRALARLMGGDAGAESRLGRGSLFWFTARLHKEADAQRMSHAANITPAEIALATRYAGRRILVVDDDDIIREVAFIFLNDIAAQQVDLAANGREAIEKAAANDYDLILMDLQMPVMDGIEACRQIRALSKTDAVPIIAVTADAFPEDRERCLDAGMDDVISKPYTPDVFFATILKWLSGEAVRGPRDKG